MQVKAIKEDLLSASKNCEQRTWLTWLRSVLSYLQVYYAHAQSAVPINLRTICKQNHPFFTNAPGGCGKSWLIKQIVLFVQKCLPLDTVPVWATDGYESLERNGASDASSFFVSVSDFPPGRLGRVATIAPSGVAAGNCDGFTFHNGLRSCTITLAELRKDPSPEVLSRLTADFARVVCLVVDEYSMTPLLLLAYLDKIAHLVRPAYSEVLFGGIPVLVTGDAFQLPVVRAFGLLDNHQNIPEYLRRIHEHCTRKVFFLELSRTVRQNGDEAFANLLLRMRLCESTQQDADTLNIRFFKDFKDIAHQSSAWTHAPILTATN